MRGGRQLYQPRGSPTVREVKYQVPAYEVFVNTLGPFRAVRFGLRNTGSYPVPKRPCDAGLSHHRVCHPGWLPNYSRNSFTSKARPGGVAAHPRSELPDSRRYRSRSEGHRGIGGQRRCHGMRFEWDPEKAQHKVAKHGIDFEEAATAFADPLSITRFDPVVLASDVAGVFKTSKAVNAALRSQLKRKARRKPRRVPRG